VDVGWENTVPVSSTSDLFVPTVEWYATVYYIDSCFTDYMKLAVVASW
jgi:hypothetical protein